MQRTSPSPPIIICGFPRSATTFLKQLICSHPDIAISGEYRLLTAFATPLLCAQVASLHRRGREQWRNLGAEEARAAVLRATWYYADPGGLAARRFGNRTPGNERFFRFFEWAFRCTPPLYLYAIRDPASVISSYRRTPWGGRSGIWMLALRLGWSLRLAQKFGARCPGRLLPVFVDRATAPRDRQALVEAVFHHLGEQPTDEVRRFADRWQIVNASGAPPDDALRTRILGNPLVRHLRRKLGYTNT